MGDKSKKTSEIPSRKPLKFTPKIPPRKKANPEITNMKPLDVAENIVDKEVLQRLKLSHEGSESKSARSQQSKMDLHHPVTLPWSDNSGPVPDEEDSEASASSSQDESCIKPAEELGLLKESEERRMLFFQLPQSLPFVKLPAVAGRREIKGPTSALEKGSGLQELPAGYVGKMMVYKSGNVKMKLGDTLFDVSPGVKRHFPQDVAAINTKEKHCCIIGNIDKHVVVTPDLDSLLDDGGDLSALSSKKECSEPSQQNEGIPLNSGDADEDISLGGLRESLPTSSPFPDQNKDADQDQTKIKPEKELGLTDESEDNQLLFFQLPSSLPVAKRPHAAAAASASAKGKEIKAEGKYWVRDASSNRLKSIEDKSSKKSDGNTQEDAGI